MPTYTYTCTACNDLIEKRQSFSDPPLTTCEQCGGALRKIIHPVGIVFKGSGWYITDSRSANNLATPGSAKAPSTSEASESSTSATSKDSKTTKDSTTSSSSSSTSSGKPASD